MKTTGKANGYRSGVVLAAGLGSRLVDENSGRLLKPLVPVDGISLLVRTLQGLEICCDRVVVVLGYGAAVVQDAVVSKYRGSLELQFIVNDRYRLANGVSALTARGYLDGEFILVMADHIVDPGLLEQARDFRLPAESAALLVDYKLDSIYDMADATKVLEESGKIVAIGKDLADYNCIDTGIFVCTTALMDGLERIFAERGDVTLSAGVQWLAESGRMYAVDIADGFWQDVDTPEMLEHAEKILALRGSGCLALKN